MAGEGRVLSIHLFTYFVVFFEKNLLLSCTNLFSSGYEPYYGNVSVHTGSLLQSHFDGKQQRG